MNTSTRRYRVLDATFTAFILRAARTFEVALRPRRATGISSSFLSRAPACRVSLRMSAVVGATRAAARVRFDESLATEWTARATAPTRFRTVWSSNDRRASCTFLCRDARTLSQGFVPAQSNREAPRARPTSRQLSGVNGSGVIVAGRSGEQPRAAPSPRAGGTLFVRRLRGN